MTRDDLLAALQSNNVQAFLRLIRQGESSQNEDAYTVMFGGSHFESFADHPRQVHTAGGYTSSAAGAYQFLQRTWDSLVKQYGFTDFSPINQDCAAVALIAGRGALQDVLAGRIDAAIRKCGKEWASLPGSPYGQPTQKQDKAIETYLGYGGSLADSPVPVPPVSQEVKPMAPLVLPILSALTSLIPQLGQLFGSGSEVANRNIAAGSILAQKITEVTQSVNLQEAAEKIQNDPQALQAARNAVRDTLPQITEAGGGGIEGARKAAEATGGDWRKVVFTFPFLLFVALVPLIYAVVAAALVKQPWLAEFSDDARMMVITAVINLILGSIIGYVYGQSNQKNRGEVK
jgi:muramidase (phage lysozyme)